MICPTFVLECRVFSSDLLVAMNMVVLLCDVLLSAREGMTVEADIGSARRGNVSLATNLLVNANISIVQFVGITTLNSINSTN